MTETEKKLESILSGDVLVHNFSDKDGKNICFILQMVKL